jgi:hypothetical protein
MRHERLNPLGGFFGIYRAKRHRRDHQTAHDQLGDLFAKILPKVFSSLVFLAFHGCCNQFCPTHLRKIRLHKNPDRVGLDLPVQRLAKIKKPVDLSYMLSRTLNVVSELLLWFVAEAAACNPVLVPEYLNAGQKKNLQHQSPMAGGFGSTDLVSVTLQMRNAIPYQKA